MPFYDYECKKCGHVHEASVLIKNRHHWHRCPECGGVANFILTGTTAIYCNLEGGQNVIKKVQQMTKEIARRQKARGEGPVVDAIRREEEFRKKAKEPKKEKKKSAKWYAQEMKKIAQRKFGIGWNSDSKPSSKKPRTSSPPSSSTST